ncbi:hypothetical protein HK097_007145, partial [Rhizophlyctis rosea]
ANGGRVSVKLKDAMGSASKTTAADPLGKAEKLPEVDMKSELVRLMDTRKQNTRDWFPADLVSWLQQTNQSTFWLTGPPGSGKSVMAAVAVDSFSKMGNAPVAMFFCRFDDKSRRDPRMLVCTIAAQLGRIDPAMQQHIVGVFNTNPNLVTEEPIGALIDMLLHQTFLAVEGRTDPIVVLIDALDELQELEDYRDANAVGGRQKSQFLDALSRLIRSVPSFVRFLISSRPNAVIEKCLQPLHPTVCALTEETNNRDLYVHAESELGTVFHMPEQRSAIVETLVQKSQGLFIWLNMACSLILDGDEPDEVVRNIDNIPLGTDEMYRAILTAAYPESSTPLANFRLVIGCLAITEQDATVAVIAALLDDMSETTIYGVLNRIRELVEISKIGQTHRVRLIHKSVGDFLFDPQRCETRFCIPADDHHLMLAKKCIHIIGELQDNICLLDDAFMLNKDVDRGVIEEQISEDLRYACRFWSVHLLKWAEAKGGNLGDQLEEICTLVLSICETNLLHMVEVFSWLEDIPSLLESIESLIRWTSLVDSVVKLPETDSERSWEELNDEGNDNRVKIRELASDLLRLVREFSIPIQQSALQIYRSVLPFAPRDCLLTSVYMDNNAGFDVIKVGGFECGIWLKGSRNWNWTDMDHSRG